MCIRDRYQRRVHGISEREGIKSQFAEQINAPGTEKNKAIIQYGLKNECRICREVLDRLIEMIATELSNIGVITLCYSGLYLVGSLINSIKDYMMASDKFFKTYMNKDKMIPVVQNIPIIVVTEEDLGLFGAFVDAQREVYEQSILF
eukprot:TRINITY_DN1675_c0_g1_i2.p2 TRINITY_DN1675_c0_g1~~TRINITY_DN1675_c0_g1_i2.p2  ORF type:complete len:147 (+),score=53.71 TRINITY_DN1675_c0_g1_i2:63-503(+)